jgi:hypothetical protein
MLFELAVDDLKENGVFQGHNPVTDVPQMLGDHIN